METQSVTENKLTAIERALAAAKAHKANRTVSGDNLAKTDAVETVRPSKEERNAAKAARDAERITRREAKAALKAELEATSGKKPTHMKKVERVRSKLPSLGDVAARHFEVITSELSVGQIDALAQHLSLQARALRTLAAGTSQPLPVGASVRIIGGDPKFIGSKGKIVHSHKLRATVHVDGVRRPVYIYTGEAEVVSE